MRVLIVDNHDSYTYNLFQLLAEVLGREPVVAAHDDPGLDPLMVCRFDAVVVSSGPGTPLRAADVGRVPEVLAAARVPVLGVGLGHQAIAYAAGASITAAPAPRHGHLTRVRHGDAGLFAGLPQDFTAVRYHSLRVPEPLPADLVVTAWAEDGVVMALEHRSLPRWGVQFHPESVASEHGRTLIANFAALAARSRRDEAEDLPRAADTAVTETPVGDQNVPDALRDRDSASSGLGDSPRSGPRNLPPRGRAAGGSRHSGSRERSAPAQLEELRFWVLDREVDAEAAFLALYAGRDHAFWLDSSQTGGTARFSFLGCAEGPRGEVLTYRTGEGAVRVRAADGTHTSERGTIFDTLATRVRSTPAAHPDLPFDFTGGYVGYFGYELKADCGGAAAHRSPTPDAVWLRCDRFIAVDHVAHRTYLVCADGDRGWLERTERVLGDLCPPAGPAPGNGAVPDPARLLERPRQAYLSDVKECLGELAEGESYEICLTSRARLPAPADETAFYRRLRRSSPAPYAALLRLGDTTVHSASPERFLRVDRRGGVESRPIKGTAPRHVHPLRDARLQDELRSSAKTRAENLMIVDLLRNDLGRVCEVGSVQVPAFMYIESYATVHQLVSTVRGRLRAGVSAVDAVRACFPGGSMTGAPKLRTMQILDRLEPSARGVYSGALGYLSYSGTADLSIVIRAAVNHGGELTVGAGGAIVLDSDPAQEYAEALLKAAVPLSALGGAG